MVQPVLGNLADGIHPGAPVRVHHAFGKARGAAGVVDGDAGVLVKGAGPRPGNSASRPSQQSLVIVDDALHRRGLHHRAQLRVHQQHFGSAVAENPVEFPRLQPGVEHHQDGADPHRPEVGLQRHCTVKRQHGHAVARANAQVMQGGGEAINAPLKLRIGKSAFPIHHGRGLGIHQRAAREKVEWGERRDHRFRGLIVPPRWGML